MLIDHITYLSLFSSSESKAQVNLFDQNLAVFRRCRFRRCSCRRLIPFSSSPPEPQPNLA